MKIVIDSGVAYNTDRAFRIFTIELLQDLALLEPDHEFIFLKTEKDTPWQAGKNVHEQALKKTGIQWLDRKQVNKALIKWQADRFITRHGMGFSIRHFFGERNAKKDAGRVQELAFIDNAELQTLDKAVAAITLVKPACRSVVTALSWAEAESIKTQYTGGRSFFLFTGNISEEHQLVDLLKAFSIFKKWQQSNMQLVIAGYTTAWTPVFEEKLLLYKYRNDTVVLKDAPAAEIAKLVAASYALVYPAAGNSFPLALIWAVQSNKAAIASDTDINRQISAAAEWVDQANTAEAFAKAMILLYKDESRQQWLAQQTKEAAGQLNRGQMLTEVWRCIEK